MISPILEETPDASPYASWPFVSDDLCVIRQPVVGEAYADYNFWSAKPSKGIEECQAIGDWYAGWLLARWAWDDFVNGDVLAKIAEDQRRLWKDPKHFAVIEAFWARIADDVERSLKQTRYFR